MNRSLLLSLCLILLMLLLPSFNTNVQAQGPNLFVSPDGTGDTCSQALPCLPDVGIQKAVSGNRVYFRYGNYTGGTHPIFTIEKNISLYGGWDGVDTGPFFLDPETYVTTIDGQKARSLLLIDNDDSSYLTIIINGFTFTRGYSMYGGAIEVKKGLVFIEGNRFLDNDAISNGGAIHIVSESDVVILNNVFNDNTASMGGSIFVDVPEFEYPTVTIQENQFENNQTTDYGAGIYVGESNAVNIFKNQFKNNHSDNGGGGIYIGRSEYHYPDLLIESNLFTGNSCDEYFSGSAIRIEINSATITRNLFKDNDALHTSVIDIGSGDTAPSVISNNMIIRSETAISIGGTSIGNHKIWNNTIVDADEVAINITANGDPVSVINNIIAYAEISIQSDALYVTGTNNLFYNNYSNPHELDNPLNEDESPSFVDSVTDDYHLSKYSPAIDAGATVALTVDFDGDKRPSGAGFDIGADEVMSDEFIFLPLILK